MKKQLLLSLLLLSLGLSVSAQKARKLSKSEKNLRVHVTYLASDELEGRRTGEKGATFAAGYISNMFQRYKLEAGYTDPEGAKSYLQPFDFVSGIEFGEATSMTLDSKPATRGEDWSPFIFTSEADIPETEIVFALHGISSERVGHDDYAGIDAKGKIVAVLSGTPDGGGPHSPYASFNASVKANIAKEKGAIALLVISDSEKLADDRLASTGFDQSLGDTSIPLVVVSRDVGAQILNLKGAGELSRVEKWLASKPANANVRFTGLKRLKAALRIDVEKLRTEGYNVVGVLRGRDEALRGEAIVIGAHFDHLGRGGKGSLAPNSNDVHNGADDNASGTSALIELARRFTKEKKNKRTVIFIAFGGEEEGLLGSKAYISNPVFPLENTVAMFNMDMVGRLKGEKLTVGGIGTAGLWKDLVERINSPSVRPGSKSKTTSSGGSEAATVPVSLPGSEAGSLFNLQLNQDGFGPSDHASFYAAKIPVLFFFTGTHSDYHKPTDDSEKINYVGLEKITDFVGDLVSMVDARRSRPVYSTTKSPAPRGGRRGFNVSLGTIPAYGDSDNTGLMLDGVRDGSPASIAGLQAGDKIVKIAGKQIRNITDYMFMLGEMKAGEPYDIVVLREEKELALKIVPDPRK